jgi:hypothetical protein
LQPSADEQYSPRQFPTPTEIRRWHNSASGSSLANAKAIAPEPVPTPAQCVDRWWRALQNVPQFLSAILHSDRSMPLRQTQTLRFRQVIPAVTPPSGALSRDRASSNWFDKCSVSGRGISTASPTIRSSPRIPDVP